MFAYIVRHLKMPSVRKQINEAADQMYTELEKLLLRLNTALKIYNYWKKIKYNKLKKAASFKKYKRLQKKIKLFFKDKTEELNNSIFSMQRRTNLLKEHKRNLLQQKQLFSGRSNSEP